MNTKTKIKVIIVLALLLSCSTGIYNVSAGTTCGGTVSFIMPQIIGYNVPAPQEDVVTIDLKAKSELIALEQEMIETNNNSDVVEIEEVIMVDEEPAIIRTVCAK